jgi:hypothetical protein
MVLLTRRWGISWLCLALALALHVLDEALTGFLPLYNAVVKSLRVEHAWLPFPTFTFRLWSVVLGRWALGVYSSPVLLAAAVALVVTAMQSRAKAQVERRGV